MINTHRTGSGKLADVGRERVADLDLGSLLGELCEELVVDAGLNEDQCGR